MLIRVVFPWHRHFTTGTLPQALYHRHFLWSPLVAFSRMILVEDAPWLAGIYSFSQGDSGLIGCRKNNHFGFSDKHF
jgi:hypothetical protein